MVEETMGPLIWGFHLDVFFLVSSGIFYLLCSFLVWKSYRKYKDELIGALLAFMLYQALNMFFMGIEIQTMNIIYSNIAALSVFIGSAYMLKFPFSSYSRGTRRVIFLSTMIFSLSLFIWFMQNEMRQMQLMEFILWYDILVNGLLVGGSLIVLALRTKEKWLRLKAFGGGTGVISCCMVANGAMLSGAILTSTFFGFLAPVLILSSLIFTRNKQ